MSHEEGCGRPHVGNVLENVFARLLFRFGGGWGFLAGGGLVGFGSFGGVGGGDGNVGPVLPLLYRQSDQGTNLK